jgi:flagellar biosynthetic protein FliQ
VTDATVLQIGSDALRVTLFVAGPMLIAAMVVGIGVSVLQAITQINESTLTFIPKMVAVVLVLTIMAPWMLEVLQNYTADIIRTAGEMR